ncbi:RagB/SusD family nutrient uptake outer membrane protein [uncultured Bacteroides sp.]|uniref:RagB/SusD family nutrient uptake outer membrane protein n=1 Tax=uncultured Bacteroides sp. TaxID=162156 RepID=UPI002607410C|nr:RagB/SusD family nutrient uptake outer membrane protein [uncultured Bacteroides sp.]
MKKIFNYIYSGLCVLGLVTSNISCSDFLDETIYSELTEDNAFTTANDALSAVNALYEPLPRIVEMSIFFLNDMPTDACFKKEKDFEILNELQLNGNSDVLTGWKRFYDIVGRANIAIDNIEGIPTEEFGDNEQEALAYKKRLMGEAYFMRGFAYYHLTDLFYTVPLINSSDVPVDAILPPATIAELDKQIHDDLTMAITENILPQKYASKSDAGRATYGAALGYLCRLHMRTAGRMRQAGQDASQEWEKALDYANQLLQLRGSVYNLQQNVWDIFDPERDECLYNDELIFTVHSNPNSSAGTSAIGMTFTPWSYDCGWDLCSIPLELVWDFDKDDERFSKLIVTSYNDIYDPEKKKYKIPATPKETGTIYQEITENGELKLTIYEMTSAFTQKYKYTKPLTYNYNTGNNFNFLRLADIILCKAEILNELNGPSQEAIDLINEIRERAFQNSEHNLKLSDYATTEELRNAICDERLFELNNEATRRPDLIRMGLWKNRLEKYFTAIKQKYIYNEDNVEQATGTRPDYSANWKVYPTDLTENDIRRYFPAPKRESDINPDLLNCRDFTR